MSNSNVLPYHTSKYECVGVHCWFIFYINSWFQLKWLQFNMLVVGWFFNGKNLFGFISSAKIFAIRCFSFISEHDSVTDRWISIVFIKKKRNQFSWNYFGKRCEVTIEVSLMLLKVLFTMIWWFQIYFPSLYEEAMIYSSLMTINLKVFFLHKLNMFFFVSIYKSYNKCNNKLIMFWLLSVLLTCINIKYGRWISEKVVLQHSNEASALDALECYSNQLNVKRFMKIYFPRLNFRTFIAFYLERDHESDILMK